MFGVKMMIISLIASVTLGSRGDPKSFKFNEIKAKLEKGIQIKKYHKTGFWNTGKRILKIKDDEISWKRGKDDSPSTIMTMKSIADIHIGTGWFSEKKRLIIKGKKKGKKKYYELEFEIKTDGISVSQVYDFLHRTVQKSAGIKRDKAADGSNFKRRSEPDYRGTSKWPDFSGDHLAPVPPIRDLPALPVSSEYERTSRAIEKFWKAWETMDNTNQNDVYAVLGIFWPLLQMWRSEIKNQSYEMQKKYLLEDQRRAFVLKRCSLLLDWLRGGSYEKNLELLPLQGFIKKALDVDKIPRSVLERFGPNRF